MANYTVGNLEIAFKAVDQTSASFKDLAKNLRAIQKLINNIANSDLTSFKNNIKAIRKEFTPFLKNITSASDVIIALNSSLQQVGLRNLTKVAQDFSDLKRGIEGATGGLSNLNEEVITANKDLQETSIELSNVAKQQSRVEIVAKRLAAALSTHTYDRLSKEVGSLASQWKNLYATMQKSGMYDTLTDGLFSSAASAKLGKLTQDYLAQRSAMDKVNDAFARIEEQYRRSRMTTEELTIEQYRNVEASRRQRIEFLQASLALGTAGANTKAYQKELAELTSETKKATSGFTKFIKSIGRIALYRAIRRALQLITQSITETIQEFAKVDDNVNNTMSHITSSLKVIRLSFGAIFIPLLQAIEPILSQIASRFADLANLISQATANGDTYWAINSKAIQDYREQLQKTTGTLASFDKFNSLNAKDDSSIFFEEREILKENKAVKETSKIIDGIKNALAGLGKVLEFIGKHLDLVAIAVGGIIAFKLISKVSTLISTLNGVSGILSLLSVHPIIAIVGAVAAVLTYLYATNEDFRESINNLLKALSPLVSLVSNLLIEQLKPIFEILQLLVDNIIAPLATILVKNLTNRIEKLTQILTPIINIIKNIYNWINKVIDAVSNSFLGKVVGGIGQGISGIVGGIGKIFGFADGGLPDRGTMFIAGEAGAEVVYNTPSGQSGVANINQLKSAFYQALVEWGNTRKADNTPIVVYLDGEEVYRNVTNRAAQRGNHWA